MSALRSPTVEATDLKSVQSQFESERGEIEIIRIESIADLKAAPLTELERTEAREILEHGNDHLLGPRGFYGRNKLIFQQAVELFKAGPISNYELARRLSISNERIAARMRRHAGIPVFTRPRVWDAEITQFYPFFIKSESDSGAALMKRVNSVLPTHLGREAREDICQEMLADILSGDLSESEAKTEWRRYYTAYFRQFPRQFGPVSLDSGLRAEDSRTYYDVVASHASSPLEELMWKEEREEEQKWKNVWRRDAPITNERQLELRESLSGFGLSAAHERRKAGAAAARLC